jgi:hypothetical protein
MILNDGLSSETLKKKRIGKDNEKSINSIISEVI